MANLCSSHFVFSKLILGKSSLLWEFFSKSDRLGQFKISPPAPLPPLPPYYSGAAMVPHPASHIIFGQHHSLEILPEASAFKVETLEELQYLRNYIHRHVFHP